ncbi:hypothetical protein ruthe_03140 [Rubellimicrobium thermophilum DSM 16684]|uniref:Uncharacterized protein n=2 Tax=Rubellimicrobium TaxID=295418 RepID=S9QSV9_9RHOB|nr:hypothetical protein ruthe_03140 [Rubellimicrobium thermophilum DSM 16684]
MARGSWMQGAFDRAVLRRWTAAVRAAPQAELSVLRRDLARAEALRLRLGELMAIAGDRLAQPRIGSQAFPRPPGTDWAWRPRLWRGPLARKGEAGVLNRTPIGEEATVFHDCPLGEITLRQIRNSRTDDLAPFGLRIDVFRFDGSYFALAIDLPPSACEGLKRRHLVRLDIRLEMERPIEIFARLNIRHGPNAEQLVRELPLHQLPPQGGEVWVEFDLAYTKLNEKRLEKMWLDLIFEGPRMNQITLRDITFARYPRAEL